MIILSGLAHGTTYYVATTGADSASCTRSSPCFSISRAMTLLSAGDTLSIHAGKYYGVARTSTSGSPADLITLQAYGDGAVIIDGSETRHFTSWTVYSGNIYKAKYTGAKPNNCASSASVGGVIIDGAPLNAAAQYCSPAGIASVTMSPGQWFYDTNTSVLYVYTLDGSDPSAHDLIIPWDVNHTRYSTPSIFDVISVGNYWKVSGLTIRGGANYGLVLGTNATAVNNSIQFNMWTGLSSSSFGTISGNIVSWNMFANWPRGKCEAYNTNQRGTGYASCWIWGSWGGGLLYSDHSTVTTNVSYMNGGEGIISFCAAGPRQCPGMSRVSLNTAYDNWSVNIYVDNEPFYTISRNFIYCNAPTSSWTFNSGSASAGAQLNKFLRANGVFLTDEDYGGGPHLTNTTVTTNVILQCRNGIAYMPQCCSSGSGSALLNSVWAHNTIVLPAVNGIDSVDGGSGSDTYNGIEISKAWGSPPNSGNTIEDNLVYGQGSTNLVILVNGSLGPGLRGTTWNYNTYYDPTNSSAFGWNDGQGQAGTYNFANWKTTLAGLNPTQGMNEQYGDPLLNNPASLIAVPDKKLSSTLSAAYHKGVPIPGITTDYLGCAFASLPSVGAFELFSAPPHLTSHIADLMRTPTHRIVGGDAHPLSFTMPEPYLADPKYSDPCLKEAVPQ